MIRMMHRVCALAFLPALMCCSPLAAPAQAQSADTAGAPVAGAKPLPYRWVFISRGLGSDADLDKVLDLVRTAAQHGCTGIVFDPDFSNIPQWAPDRLARVKKVKEECARLKLDLVAMIMSAGYSNGLYPVDHNLAEGLPVRDVLFEVKSGLANVVPERPLARADGRLETATGNAMAGLDLQDEPGRVTFVDTAAAHDGRASLRFEPAAGKGKARIMKCLPQPAKHYVARFWVKSTGLTPGRITLCVYDGDRQVNWFPINIGENWQKVEFPVLTGDQKDTRLFIGTWDAKQGKFWLADLEIFEPGLVNVLRRPGTPLTVRKDAGGEACVEGRDFQKVADPALKVNEGYHTPPAIRILPGGAIHDGDRLRVSYYVHPVLRKGQVVSCMSEPETYDLWRKAVEATWAAVQPRYWFLDMDEIRGGGTCQACRDRKNADGTPMTPGQILGDCVTRQQALIRAVCPDATVAIWSDIFDPEHNGKADYFTVPGGYAGAWKYIPRDLVMCPWNLGIAEKSLAFFEGLGMRTIAGAYYDADNLDDTKRWLDLMTKQPHGCGIVYFTWESKFGLLPAFGDLVSGQPAPAAPAAVLPAAPPVPAGDLLATASPPADDKAWTPIFNGRNLTGWKAAKGTWQVADGCIAGAAEAEAGARLDSEKKFGDCEVVCSLYADNCKYATVQLRDWKFSVRWPSGQEGTWRTLRLVSRGGAVQASLDGAAVPGDAPAATPGAGVIRIFVGHPYGIKIKDLRMRSL